MGKVFDFEFMLSTVPQIMAYLPVTLYIAVLSGAVALVLGFLVALIRFFHVTVLTQIAAVYISLMRGTPAMVQLLLAYYGIPVLLRAINEGTGANLSVNGIPAIVFAIIAMTLNNAAFMSESLRGALLAVDAGQLEACYSVNMSTFQALHRVILPQAFLTALPSRGNTFISLLKETSLVFNISVVEIMAAAKIVGGRSFRFFEVYIVVAAIYWVCCFILEKLFALLEKKLRTYERSAVR